MQFIRNLLSKFRRNPKEDVRPMPKTNPIEQIRAAQLNPSAFGLYVPQSRNQAFVDAPRRHQASHFVSAQTRQEPVSSSPSTLETYLLLSALSGSSSPGHSAPAPAYESPVSGGGSFDGGGASSNWDSSPCSSDSSSSYDSSSSSSSYDSGSCSSSDY